MSAAQPTTSEGSRPRLLLISYRFPPESYPLAIGLRGVVRSLQDDWDIDVITAAKNAEPFSNVTVHHVPGRSIEPGLRALSSMRLDKIARLLTWPDPYWPWIWPALRRAEQVIERRRPDAILVFMMPFSTGFVGTLLKKRTGLPLVMNLNDSPTCSDMRPVYPTRGHYALFRWMEDHFIRSADRVVYVSRQNRDRVRTRQPPHLRDRLELVRCSADLPAPPEGPASTTSPPPDWRPFRIVYTGALSGWHALDKDPSPSLVKRAYRAWNELGTYVRTPLDVSTHSPVYVGQAVRRGIDMHPEWEGRIQVDVYGNTFPEPVVQRVLEAHDLTTIVNVHGRIPHDEAMQHVQEADLLFLTLPDRLDGSAGGRISLKTYEYLLTDRPILAAVPPGENREFLSDHAGTYLTDPKDVGAMTKVIETLATQRFSGRSLSVERPGLEEALSSTTRASALSSILRKVAVCPNDDVDRAHAPSLSST